MVLVNHRKLLNVDYTQMVKLKWNSVAQVV